MSGPGTYDVTVTKSTTYKVRVMAGSDVHARAKALVRVHEAVIRPDDGVEWQCDSIDAVAFPLDGVLVEGKVKKGGINPPRDDAGPRPPPPAPQRPEPEAMHGAADGFGGSDDPSEAEIERERERITSKKLRVEKNPSRVALSLSVDSRCRICCGTGIIKQSPVGPLPHLCDCVENRQP